MSRRQVDLADVTFRSLPLLTPTTSGRIGYALPVVEALDEAGFAVIDVWGEMSVAQCLKWLSESPWERLRALCARISQATPQMQLAGSCLVGSWPRPWGLVQEFIARARDCGVRSFLIYEPLNDGGALEPVFGICRALDAQVRLGVVHGGRTDGDFERTVEVARRLAAGDPDGLCLKTTGALGPHSAQTLVREIRRAVHVPLELDLDNAGGLGGVTAALCAEAGADLIYASAAPGWLDPAASSVSVVCSVLDDLGVECGLRPEALAEAARRFASLADVGGTAVGSWLDLARHWPETLEVPAGLLHKLALRLEEQGALTRLREVIAEFLRVRSDMGAEALGAPLTDIAGTQAVLNVLYGRRWHVVPDEMRAYLRGAYGRPQRPVAPDVLRAVLGEEAATEQSGGPDESAPAVSLEDKQVLHLDEEALLRELAPEEAAAFLGRRQALAQLAGDQFGEDASGEAFPAVDAWDHLGPNELRELVAILESSNVEELTVETAGAKVSLRKAGAVSGSPAAGSVVAPGSATGSRPAVPGESAGEAFERPLSEQEHVVKAPMVGTFYRGSAPEAPPLVVQGQRVAVGDPLCMLEAMKLLNEVIADVAGVVKAILVEDGEPVEYGQPLFVIETDRE